MIKSYLSAFKNKPYVLILLPWVFYITAMTIVSGSLIYYCKYIYKSEGTATVAIMMLLGTALVCIPIWVWVAKKLGKKLTFCIGMLIVAAVGIVNFFFAHILGIPFFLGMMVAAGIGISPTYVMPWAIVPDTIEYDYTRSGERKEGTYYGLWTFMSKLGQAFANFLIGWVLAFSGFIQNLPTQTETVNLGIRLLFGPIMALFYIIGAVIVLFYPISQKMYEDIRAKAVEMEKTQQSE
jgi:GPH family glycoside/pentoside/hexuronide:cation symporter